MSRTRNIADLASQTLATDSEVSAAVSAAVAKSIVDAKGDLIVATAADTVARLAVGANGDALVADSAAATGVKWETPVVASGVPSGAVIHVASSSAPTGWLKANGALVSRSTYAALFTAIGTTFGAGDGSTTFALPDLRGEFLRGWDDGRGIDSGRSFGSSQSSENLSHNHSATQFGFPYAGSEGFHFQYSGPVSFSTQTVYPSITIAASGGTEARPRNIALLACIKF